MAIIPGGCRFAEHVWAASALGGAEIAVEACEVAAAHRVTSRFDSGEGLVIQLETEVCDEHERKLWAAHGWVSSNKFRRPT